ncbi:MAG: hypothetical protein GY847_03735 [Proteobacteria bacterium]|nr:hypothetical protein [Pseudomonadota bacterium]
MLNVSIKMTKTKIGYVFLLILVLVLGVVGCGSVSSSNSEDLGDDSDDSGDLPKDKIAKHALTQMDTCDAFVSYSKKAAIQRIMAYAETQKSAIDACWDGSDNIDRDKVDPEDEVIEDDDSGADADGDMDGDIDGDGDADFDDNDNEIDIDDGDDEGDHTETNVQEKGVDEADLIKTDGDYLYALSGGDLIIVEAAEDGLLIEFGRIEVGGRSTELFLYGDLAVVFSNLEFSDVPDAIKMSRPDWASESEPYEPEMDDGRNYYQSGYTQIAIIDVEDRSSPNLLRSITYAGSYVTSRRIDSSMRAVISTPTPALNLPVRLEWQSYCSMPESVGRAVFAAAVDALIEEAGKLINELTLDDILPKKIDNAGNGTGSAESIVDCSEVYGPETAAGTGLLTVVSIDLSVPETQQTDIAVFGDKGLVYASKSSLYLTSSNDYVQQAWNSGIWAEETSGIHKFDISSSPAKAIYKATGTVTGRMLNQFCLGEHDGFLRVATTTGEEWDSNTWDNHISVFEEKDGKLEEVGHLGGIGKEEREKIYAARFMGDRGFLVTFRQTDPLFTFDLSDPYKPKKVGEWLGPGFSTYLHPYGENHMIAVGRESWRFAISLYDLTDFASPEMVERVYPGQQNEGLESVALDDHKAITFDASRELLALPFHGWMWNEYRDRYDTGILLYNVSSQGFEQAGELSLLDITADEYFENNEGAAQRSVFIDNTLYGISRCRITSADLDNPSQMLHTLILYAGSHCEGNDGGDTDIDIDVDDGDWDDEEEDIDVDIDTEGDEGETEVDTDTESEVEPDSDTGN